jgi:hypothetical protein
MERVFSFYFAYLLSVYKVIDLQEELKNDTSKTLKKHLSGI